MENPGNSENREEACRNTPTRVTSVEQLSLAEFSGEQATPKVYETDHKNVPGIWMDGDSKVKIWANF